jgi:hypothetical protein
VHNWRFQPQLLSAAAQSLSLTKGSTLDMPRGRQAGGLRRCLHTCLRHTRRSNKGYGAADLGVTGHDEVNLALTCWGIFSRGEFPESCACSVLFYSHCTASLPDITLAWEKSDIHNSYIFVPGFG